MIKKLLQYFFQNSHNHLTDDRLASLLCNELSFSERVSAKWHLANCWRCRLRQADLEGSRAEEVVAFYQHAVNARDLGLEDRHRAKFAQDLEHRLNQRMPASPQRRSFPAMFRVAIPKQPAFALGVVCFLTVAIFTLSWWHQRTPAMSSSTFLNRAEQWDAANLGTDTGVVYQSVRITAPLTTFYRAIYRDRRGARLQKIAVLQPSEEAIQHQLVRAGVDWDQPISAASYQAWHNGEHSVTDRISRPGAHLLKLTTAVQGSPVLMQTLTVRDSDFHPVRRTIALRDVGTIEIAELDFKVLGATASVDGVFEPLADVSSANSMSHPGAPGLLRMPHQVTQQELDEAELSVRFLLNQLHADSGEQIELERQAREIVIGGVVDTDERKRELQRQLALVAHTRFAIQSVAELNDPSISAVSEDGTSAAATDQASALEVFLRRRGRSLSQSNNLAQQLANTALTVGQESKAIADLNGKFVPDPQRSVIAEATLSELLYSHRERLMVAVNKEQDLLAEVAAGSGATPAVAYPAASSVMIQANRNLALLKELTRTDRAAQHSAEEMLSEMSMSLAGVKAAANEIFSKTQSASALSGKK